jgi:predicted TIM-barrel fold metal-dependent hydrolase
MGDESVATDKRPTDHLGTNLFVTVLDDFVGFRMVEQYPWLADTGMFSSDYPHSVTLWPNSSKVAEQLTEGLSPDDAAKILSGNAARVYGV